MNKTLLASLLIIGLLVATGTEARKHVKPDKGEVKGEGEIEKSEPKGPRAALKKLIEVVRELCPEEEEESGVDLGSDSQSGSMSMGGGDDKSGRLYKLLKRLVNEGEEKSPKPEIKEGEEKEKPGDIVDVVCGALRHKEEKEEFDDSSVILD